MPDLFDAHCHATRKMPASAAADRPPAETTPRRRLVCGATPEDWDVVADWARMWPGTTPAFGIHPWEAAAVPDDGWEEKLISLLLRFPEAWVGEIGLDGAKTSRAPMERQQEILARQLRLAAQLGRPVNLHCVKAHDELLAALDGKHKKCILHSFAGPRQMIAAFAARGAYFSVGPLASRRDTPKARARAALLPPERIVLESDAFLAPGEDAEEDLLFTLQWLSEARKTPQDALARQIADNTRRLFDDAD